VGLLKPNKRCPRCLYGLVRNVSIGVRPTRRCSKPLLTKNKHAHEVCVSIYLVSPSIANDIFLSAVTQITSSLSTCFPERKTPRETRRSRSRVARRFQFLPSTFTSPSLQNQHYGIKIRVQFPNTELQSQDCQTSRIYHHFFPSKYPMTNSGICGYCMVGPT
jgi:hypothetical protein